MRSTTKTSAHRLTGLVALGAFAGLVLGACGDDEKEEAAAACAPYFAITAQFNGEPDPATLGPLLDEVDAAAADEEIAEPLAVMTGAARTVLETGDDSIFGTPEVINAQSEVDPWMFENCTFTEKAEVTASEYKFEGVPDSFDAGTAGILLTNGGNEAHEMAIMRKDEGVTQTWDEILALPEEEAEALVVQVGGGFAPTKGSKGLSIVELVPGDYVVLCFVPTGTSVGADGTFTEGTGVPHFMGGMKEEFTVSS